MITAIAGSFGGVYQAAGESGLIFDAIDDAIGGTGGLGLGGNNGDDEPASYLNYLLFDENMVYLTGGFEVVPTSANMSQQTVALNSVIVNKPGYIYMYVSYENLSDNHVHFDDLLIEHTKSPVVQVANYYPFGLTTADSYTRVDTQPNQFLFNAGSKLNENTGNYEMFFREYDPVLGRMTAVDPMAGKYRSLTPYNYAFNTPVRLNDPSGADPFNWNFDMTTEQFVQSTDWLSDAWGARAQRYEDSYLVNHIVDYGGINGLERSTRMGHIIKRGMESETGYYYSYSGGQGKYDSNRDAALAGVDYIEKTGTLFQTHLGKSLIFYGLIKFFDYKISQAKMEAATAGMWPTWTHNQIIRAAFDETLTESEMEVLIEASKYTDSEEFQSLELSYMHAMRAPGQTVEEAEILAIKFINQQQLSYLNRGGNDALFELGMGMHTIMDSYSPAHRGYQQWDGFGGEKLGTNLFNAFIHFSREAYRPYDWGMAAGAAHIYTYYQESIRLKN
jgi:RHS repeat-associated protein